MLQTLSNKIKGKHILADVVYPLIYFNQSKYKELILQQLIYKEK